MKQQLQLLSPPVAIVLAVMFLGWPGENAYACGRGGGGFSRESPAASGSFASRAGAMGGHEGGFQSSRQQYTPRGQASREQTAKEMQSGLGPNNIAGHIPMRLLTQPGLPPLTPLGMQARELPQRLLELRSALLPQPQWRLCLPLLPSIQQASPVLLR